MPRSQQDRSGVLMARVWIEDDAGWRCRITRTTDVSRRGGVSSVVSTPEQAQRTVREWLDRCGPADDREGDGE